MKNPEAQQISQECTALLANSPFHFKPSNYEGVIPLLAISEISASTREKEKDHPLHVILPGEEYPVVEVRLVGDPVRTGFALNLDDARKLVEKLRQLPQSLQAH